MLFHLKEPDYKIVQESPTRFYGRTPKQILTTLEYYVEKIKKDGVGRDHQNLVWWLKKDFNRDDVEEVKKGEFIFVAGMLYCGDEVKDEPLFEELKINEEFSVYVPKENIGTFALWRRQIVQMKRGELYKLQNPIDVFMNTSFVPEDIAKDITDYDLTSYINPVREDIARREQLSRHPSIKVDSLQKILEDQARHLPEQN